MRKHGLESHRLYDTWSNMVRRCYHPKNTCYPKYGAKGIRVCKEWRSDPTDFIKWMEVQGWVEGLTLDRIDPLGHYTPENCRLLTLVEQNRNRTTTKLSKEDVIFIKIFSRDNPEMLNFHKAKVLAEMLNQKVSTMRNVIEGRSWKDIDIPEDM